MFIMEVALGNFSGWSYYEAAWLPDGLAARAAQLGYRVVGLSDRWSVAGAVPFHQACLKKGLRAIIGLRLDLEGLGPAQLTVVNHRGYKALCLGVTRWLETGEDHPCVPWGEWAAFWAAQAGDLWLSIPLSRGCLPPGVGPLEDWRRRREYLERLAPEGVWLELGWVNPGQRAWQRQLYPQLAGGPWRWVVMTGARCPLPDDWATLDLLQSIGTLTRLGQDHPDKLPAGDYSLPDPAALAARFARSPRVLADTAAFAEACQFAFEYGRRYLPRAPRTSGPGVVGQGADRSDDQRLSWLCRRGLIQRYRRHPWPEKPSRAALRERLNRELAVIRQTGYAGYFLIFHDVVRECSRRGIPLLARGSAAGSLICYILGVSNVCPFRFGLSFERFLNLERLKHSKLPDIDLDLPWDRRDEIIDWIYRRYGPRQVAMIGGCATFQGRAAAAEAAKCLGAPEREARHCTRRLPQGRLAKYVARRDQYVEAQGHDGDPLFEEALVRGQALDDLPRHPMMHPCGIVVADRPLTDFLPLIPSAKGFPMTQMAFEAVEDLGLLKLDLLGQAGLSVLRDAVANIVAEETRLGHAHPPGWSPLDDVDYTDPDLYRLTAAGEVRGVFHIESPAMVSLLRLCRCADLDCLVATVSVIRPGAANEDKKRRFARRYLGLEPVDYPHPSLEPVLRDTYGLLVYEEHILFAAHHFAGLDLGTADLLRRILVKKKDPQALDELGRLFAAGARLQGRTEPEIETVWRELKDFTGYMFNKAHGAAYALEACHGLWLKRGWPLPFFAAVLQNRRGFYQPLVYVLEILRHGGRFEGPDVNRSEDRYWVEGYEVRVPLGQIAGLGEAFLNRWGRARKPFANWDDFLWRTQPDPDDLDRLAKVGAVRCFFPSRPQAVWAARAAAVSGRAKAAEGLLLVAEDGAAEGYRWPENPRAQALAESELLGFPVTFTPFELWLPPTLRRGAWPIDRLRGQIGREVEIAGLVVATRTHRTARGELMKFLTLADPTGLAEVVVFPDVYRADGHLLSEARILRLRARVTLDETSSGLSLDALQLLPATAPQAADVFL